MFSQPELPRNLGRAFHANPVQVSVNHWMKQPPNVASLQVEEDAAYSTSVEALLSRLAEMEEQVRQLNESNRALGKRNEDLECEVLNKRVEQGVRLTQAVAADNGGNVSLGDEMSDTQVSRAATERCSVG